MRIIVSLIIFGLFVSVSPAFADDVFDGTKPLLCTSIEAIDCDPGGHVKEVSLRLWVPRNFCVSILQKKKLQALRGQRQFA